MTLRAPPLLIGAALAFWGWQTGHLQSALLMAALLESARLTPWRWEVSDTDFNRIADFSSVAFAVLVVWQFSNRGVHGIYAILELAPWVLFLLLAAQVYSRRGAVRLSALVVSLRTRPGEAPRSDDRDVDLGSAYVLACLLAACTGGGGAWYFAGVASLLAWLLFPARPRRYPVALWLALLGVAGACGWAGQRGVRELQYLAERLVLSIMGDMAAAETDPTRATTAIGAIGRLKFSDRVVLRVRPDTPLREPLYLREAAYDRFEYGNWKTTRAAFTAVDALPGRAVWPLGEPAPHPRSATIVVPFREERGVLPLPYGTTRIEASAGLELQRNAYEAITLEVPPGQVRVRVDFDPDALPRGAPAEGESELPGNYRDDFMQIALELGLPGRPAGEVLARVTGFFARDFRYSLGRRGTWPGRLPLATFLRRDRAGHCEYFAAATTLLLRAGGVPSRYVVGYVVNEWSPLERAWVARARHAHAWAEAWVDERWRIVDTTPAIWADYEESQRSGLQGFYDLWSWTAYQLGRIRDGDSPLSRWYGWLLLPLAGLLAWRLSRRERVQRDRGQGRRPPPGPGLDSEFAALVARLAARGVALRPGEPLGAWIERVARAGVAPAALPALRTGLRLHYRLRFDPRGLDPGERAALAHEVEAALRGL